MRNRLPSRKSLLLLPCFVLGSVSAVAQTTGGDVINITGAIINDDGEPLLGATVTVTSGQKVYRGMTDEAGKYTIRVPKQSLQASSTIRVASIGMKRVSMTMVKGRLVYNFTLKDASRDLDEAIVTGYGNISTREKTSSITSLKMDEILMPGMTSIEQALEGRVPDLVFMQNSGEVGATARMRIRGTSTLIGNREPLWVLDGIPLTDPVDVTNEQLNDPDYINYIGNAISGINPQDIERVDVLKDAAATALYGTRAANGVIIVTTKKGEPGPPRITYTTQMKFTARPRYTDSNINLMNSQERVAFGKDLTNLHYAFPLHMTMVGYEGAYYRFATGQSSYEDFLREVQRYETANTDWFKLLTQDTFNHNHTVSVSGGGETARYYASLGYNKEDGVVRSHYNNRYTAALNLQTKIAERFSANIRLNASVQKKNQLPSEMDPLGYAYNTTRALPAFNDDGSLFYYQRHAYNVGTDKNGQYKYRYNILNETQNAENAYEANSMIAALDFTYRHKHFFDLTLTTSYQRTASNTNVWYGERTNYVAQLKNGELEDQPLPGKFGLSDLPYGGVLNARNNVNENFSLRLSGNFRHSFGERKQHMISGTVGYELNTSNTNGMEVKTRGYFKDRGMQYVTMTTEELERFPHYASWLASNKPKLTADKLHRLSGWGILSYSMNNAFSVSFNGRFDASNKFGSRSNEKFLPVWSISGMLNIKDLFLSNQPWVSDFRMRTSYGKTGNMVDNQTPNLLLRQGSVDTYFGENVSTVHALPNPNLRWEQTDQFNFGLDFSFFDYRLSISTDAYYKHTKDAFNTINVSPINGVKAYTMNGSDLYNSGMSVSISGYPIRSRDWSLYLSTNYSMVFNKVKGKAANEYELNDFLNGTAIIDGQSIGTFYSYGFLGLNPRNGMPLFDDFSDRRHLMEGKPLGDIMDLVMVNSGSREPKFTGSLYGTLRWKQLSLSMSFNYSLGNKIRKFALYKDVLDGVSSENNVRKEFVNRWRSPGDEKYTVYPALLSPSDPEWAYYRWHWSASATPALMGFKSFAQDYWTMYDNADIRVVSGGYLRLSNLSLRYQVKPAVLKKTPFTNLSFDGSLTNVFTIKSSALDGQDPTQNGFSIQTALSLRPALTFGVRATF
ncbi:MAG: SusC/RagA family TonB-linked outer membrane protein [Alloprevotella sp.]|nr:SusC/RagA family TonB-linked outer membrane protein [Bacteroidales bacterium]MDY3943218.1 SusC/RagA family TonB-linked outer membrane protein [Alloprevotella sp.]